MYMFISEHTDAMLSPNLVGDGAPAIQACLGPGEVSHFSITGRPLPLCLGKAENEILSPSRIPESLFSDQGALLFTVSNASIQQVDTLVLEHG